STGCPEGKIFARMSIYRKIQGNFEASVPRAGRDRGVTECRVLSTRSHGAPVSIYGGSTPFFERDPPASVTKGGKMSVVAEGEFCVRMSIYEISRRIRGSRLRGGRVARIVK